MITVMNHSVGLQDHPWYAAHISETAAEFDIQCRAYQKSGMQTVFMEEAWNRRQEKNLLFLNFDDGYLDNWVHIMPILQHYGLKGTVYMTSDFIDPRDIIRAQFSREDSLKNDATHTAESCCAGFLSFPEMRKMEESGVMEIQAHAKTHTWYIKGPGIIDYWKPGSAIQNNGPIWMLWNQYPEFKPYYLTEASKMEQKIPYGSPIFENGKSLETVRFIPDQTAVEDLTAALTQAVKKNGGPQFFEQHNWKKLLDEITKSFGTIPGKQETEDEYYARVREELVTVKEVLEANLHKKVQGICWPGGGVNTKVVDIAKNIGYKYFTLPNRWKRNSAPAGYEDLLVRVGTPRHIIVKGRHLRPMKEADILWYLRSLKNDSAWGRQLWKIRQILALMGI